MRSEDILRKPIDRLGLIGGFLDVLPDMCFVISPEGNILEMNTRVEKLLGYQKSQLRNKSFDRIVHQASHQQFHLALQQCVVEDSMQKMEGGVLTQSGEAMDVELFISPYHNENRQLKNVCCILVRDISEKKQKELDLLRFSNIAHYTVNPVEITDVRGRIIYVNPAFEKASGYKKEEVLGKNPSIFGSGKHPKSFWKKMWETISVGKVWMGEVENRRRSGEPYYTQLLISPIVDNDAKVVGYFGVHRDLTEQKHLEHQLIHAQKMESIGMLAAGIAHEVGNPLTSISSLVQVISRSTRDEFLQEKLELIKGQISRISRIIRDLVDFSRRSSYEVQLTDVNKCVHAAVEIVRLGKKAKDITFHVQLDQNMPKLLLVPDQIEQVFVNIIINAVDAIHEKIEKHRHKEIEQQLGKISVNSKLENDDIVISIEDNGSGIGEEALPKIFEPFYTTKKIGEGTGLGLWVSYGIVKSFQGTIKAESVEAKGTTFTVRLPLYHEF